MILDYVTISMDTLTSNGLQYYMPRLLELLLDGADYTQGDFG